MGEGSAILVLETLEHAQQRDAEVLAELIGYAATTDAHHITAPSADGEGGAAAIRSALDSAGLNAGDVDYVNAHGTGTRLNDTAETAAIKDALREHAYQVPISSTKSMTGHMVGATGALEGIFCVEAIRENIIPPTIHLHDPDPDCDLDYVPHEARECAVRVAISNAFGFGGHNAVLAFQEFSG
jgi:3-oxoacyl-(acyl-carrier-protein) synthase